jgi:phage shock protein PspC (stress-responsive transcriptional regulator)
MTRVKVFIALMLFTALWGGGITAYIMYAV